MQMTDTKHGELWWERLCIVLLQRMAKSDIDALQVVTNVEWQEAGKLKLITEFVAQGDDLLPLIKLSVKEGKWQEPLKKS